ncbi:threonine--tRNA ligase [Propionibacterium cyclohexanicum]|uniref:threonine--tRNA ligase n=1 Tax=Propionibacterium cyclohexanicum TaxID=64702 RepID=UPI000B86A09B|nr:threonine--tRNA ligase [Propionibacterium cyclohexanicum]
MPPERKIIVSSTITITQDEHSQAKVIEGTTTGLDLFGEDHSIVAMKLNGITVDLATEVHDGDLVEPVLDTSDEGLSIIRHSAAHVTAQALQEIFPQARLGIGPPITDGFYYDFKTDPLSPEDLKAIEKKMAAIIKQRQRFVRRVVTEEQARAEEAAEPYKLELISDKGHPSAEDDSAVEVGGSELTIYDNVRRDGTVAWRDLCRGPHVPNTGYIKAVALTKTSAAYWRGDQHNDQLQRVYGTAWASRDDLKAYQARLVEAAKRDHRKLGTELDLFSFPEEIGPGLVVFHPKGGILRHVIESYIEQRHLEAGFDFVHTPDISKGGLFHTSGHLPYYADTMFPPMNVDEERDAQGNITHQGQEYYLKAMNCPMHNLIFRSRGRSYRELPLRFFELGHDYRYEKSGVVQGLTRMRGFTQDDSHTYCTPEQAGDEIRMLLHFFLGILRDFGLKDFYLELSTRDENSDKFIGSDDDWSVATEVLRQACESTGLELVPDPGGAAFYGPKVSVQARDALGRTWQMSTVQYDFNQPERFGLEYTAADGSHQRPVMIHSAKLGSVERFIGVLTEHYAGAFPAWLSPVQVIGVPVAGEFSDYLKGITDMLRARGVRAEVDESDDRMQKKIRNATREKVPYILIAGEQDRDAGSVSFRFRDGSQDNGIPVDEAVARILDHIASRSAEDPSAQPGAAR